MGMQNNAPNEAPSLGEIAGPLVAALGTLLAGSLSNPASAAPQPGNPSAANSAPEGGLLGGLGGFLDQLKNAGHADAVNSWVGTGQNAPIQPGQLQSALGQKNVGAIAQQSGMSEQEAISELAKALPGLVDKLTPNGQLPSLRDIAALLQQQR